MGIGSAIGGIASGIGGLLGGGTSAAVGAAGLAGGNQSDLSAAASAANPFGPQSSQFYPALSNLIAGGPTSIAMDAWNGLGAIASNMDMIFPENTIRTDTGLLSQMGNISTPTQANQLGAMNLNPTQLIGALRGGGLQANAGVTAVGEQNPYAMNAGQQFQFQQGMGALNATMASQGLIGSGKQMTSLIDYGQQEANTAMQTNIQAALGAQQAQTGIFGANQGLQGLVNTMGQNQFGNVLNFGSFLSGQQQSSFSNQLGTQQLQSTQQQNTSQNLQNYIQQMLAANQQNLNAQESVINPLLVATQAQGSSPATAGNILSGLGAAQQQSAGNLAAGLGGLAGGAGSLIGGIPEGTFGSSSGGSFSGGNFGGAFSSNPYYGGGGNAFGFTM